MSTKAAPKTPTMNALWDLVRECMDVTQRAGRTSVPDSPKARHPSLQAALKALHEHPSYLWLERGLPILMARVPRWDDPIEEFRFFQNLAIHVAFMTSEKRQKGMRLDKPRKKLRNDIEAVLQRLFKGAVKLTPDTLNILFALLDAARHELSTPRPKSVAHPALRHFIRTFLREYGPVKVEIVLEVAALAGLTCDQRTAERYIKQARIG